jgi:hypothetical protein
VAVAALDRFGRDIAEATRAIKELSELGIKVVTANVPDRDGKTAMGRFQQFYLLQGMSICRRKWMKRLKEIRLTCSTPMLDANTVAAGRIIVYLAATKTSLVIS